MKHCLLRLRLCDTCESYFSSFMNNLKSIYNQSFPVMKAKRKYTNRLPWLTAGLKESIKRKIKLYSMGCTKILNNPERPGMSKPHMISMCN